MAAATGPFFAESADDLKKQDNSGMVSQLRRDPSTLPHMFRTALGVAGKERFPTVVAKDIGGGAVHSEVPRSTTSWDGDDALVADGDVARDTGLATTVEKHSAPYDDVVLRLALATRHCDE